MAAAAIPVAEASGIGIPKTYQMNRTHVALFNLKSRLTSDDAICTPGNPANAKFRKMVDTTTLGAKIPCCDNGLFFPAIPYEYLWNNEARAFIYIITLLWCFVGVSVLADAFMAGIESITSWTSKKQVPRTHRDGRPVTNHTGEPIVDTVETPVWNEKVACLTLFALGSSAPEILIACVGCAPNFLEDALGPGTVVGSATFNLYVITGLCMAALEAGETRKIDGLVVHGIQAFFSLFAYIWLAICLMDDVVEIWEAVVTFCYFPLLVSIVYAADHNFFMGGGQVAPDEDPDVEGGGAAAEDGPRGALASMKLAGNSDTMANLTASVVHAKVKANYIQRRREAIQASTGNKAKLLSAALKNRPEETVEEHYYNALRLAREEAAGVKDRPIFVWDQGTYFFHRGAQVCELHLERLGKTDVDAYVRCKTRDGNVAGGTAYGITVEEYHFAPGQVKKTVGIPIKAEYDWGRGAFFHVLVEKSDKTPDARIDKKFEQAKIALSNERHEAIFVWAEASTQCVSTDPSAILYLQRTKDFAQEATIKIECREGSAKADTHYVPFNEKVVFLAGETSKQIAVELIQGWMPSEDTGVVDFFVDVFEDAEDTGKEQGHEIKVEILHKNAAAKRVKIEDLEELEEDATFLSQFSNALSVNGGEGSDDASILDCLMHYISLGWKVIACLIPPAHMGGGIPCFLVALVLIGICSAMISDFASMFGCLVGMTDVVTSISIVALGTSLPDTFASMLAIQADDNADNAIGNVTGIN